VDDVANLVNLNSPTIKLDFMAPPLTVRGFLTEQGKTRLYEVVTHHNNRYKMRRQL
jgi:hypothetical protein